MAQECEKRTVEVRERIQRMIKAALERYRRLYVTTSLLAMIIRPINIATSARRFPELLLTGSELRKYR